MKLLFLPFFILLKAQRSGVRGKRSSTTAAKLDVSAKSQKSLEFFKFILSQKSDNLLPNFSVTNIGTVLLRNYVECAVEFFAFEEKKTLFFLCGYNFCRLFLRKF